MRLTALLLFAIAAFSTPAVAAPACAVREGSGSRMATITGHFSLGSRTISLTMPWALYPEGATLFQEVSGDDSAGELPRMFLETGRTRAPVEDGGPIAVKPRVGERLVLTLRDEAGQALCEWAPPVTMRKGSERVFPDGFVKYDFDSKYFAHGNSEAYFQNTGAPIALNIGGNLTKVSGAYRIGGVPAKVLARTTSTVILRDPDPKPGLRIVESQGYEITIPFVEVRFILPARTARNTGTVRVEVRGADVVRQPGSGALWPGAHLIVANNSEDRIQLLCGRSLRRNSDQFDGRPISLKRNGAGIMTGECEVKYLAAGDVSLIGALGLYSTQRIRLPLPSVSIPNPIPLPLAGPPQLRVCRTEILRSAVNRNRSLQSALALINLRRTAVCVRSGY